MRQGIRELNNKRPIYKKLFSRDFSLALIECWANGESNDPRQWTAEQQPAKPYELFEKTPDFVNVYMDPSGVEWVKNMLSELLQKDKRFFSHCIGTFNQKVNRVKPILEKEEAIPLSELRPFIANVRDTWPWFEAIWWTIELSPKQLNGIDIAPVMEARKAANQLAPSSDIVIRKSIQKAFPGLANYSHVLLAQEVFSKKIPAAKELKGRIQRCYYGGGRL